MKSWFSTPAGYHYTWILPPYPEDSFAYMAWAQQAARGAWLFRIKYTALPHEAFLFNPFFLVCGWLSAIFSSEIGIIFWVLKAVGIAIFFLTFFRYLDYLGLGAIESTAASILLGVSSGLGGIVALFGWMNEPRALSADLWMPEVSTYWSLLKNPLFPFSLTLLLLSIYWVDRGTRESRTCDLWRSGLATGVMALIHPYSLPIPFAFAVIVIIVRKQANALEYLSRYLVAALPFAAYVIVVSKINPIVVKHSELGQMESPVLGVYVLGFGVPLLMFVAGLIVERARLAKRYWQIVLWFCLSVAFAYLPFWFQRKLVFGAHIPLSIMGGVTFGWILARCPTAATRRWLLIVSVVIFIPLLAATPVYLLIRQNNDVRNNADGAYFVSNDVMKGLKVLRDRSEPNDIVFAGPRTSRLIPAFSGNTTVWGHWAMSIDSEERELWFKKLFDPQSGWDDDTRSRKFWGTDIQFIFADGEFKQSLDKSPFARRVILRNAEKIFENDAVEIYRRRTS
jgi:hypothetical protein